MSDRRLNRQFRALEQLFFYMESQQLIKDRNELQKLERTRKSLSEVSGITNRSVLDAIIQLEIAPDVAAGSRGPVRDVPAPAPVGGCGRPPPPGSYAEEP